jgi:hypothetical protein
MLFDINCTEINQSRSSNILYVYYTIYSAVLFYIIFSFRNLNSTSYPYLRVFIPISVVCPLVIRVRLLS